jgi:hypothetical protein
MPGEEILQARAELTQMAKANLTKMAFGQKEKDSLLGGGTCPFLLHYRSILFCVSEILRQGCQIEKSSLLTDDNALNEDGISCSTSLGERAREDTEENDNDLCLLRQTHNRRRNEK